MKETGWKLLAKALRFMKLDNIIWELIYKIGKNIYSNRLEAFNAELDKISEELSAEFATKYVDELNQITTTPDDHIELVQALDDHDMELLLTAKIKIKSLSVDKTYMKIESVMIRGLDYLSTSYVNSASPNDLHELAVRLASNLTQYISRSHPNVSVDNVNRMQN